MIPKTKRLPKTIILLAWVSFFADVSTDMIYPLIPIFISQVLGEQILTLGLIEGIAQAVVSILAAFSGILSDKIGKRIHFVRIGYGLPIIGKTIISFATSWQSLLIGRLIDRFGKGLRGSPRDSIIANSIESSRSGEAFGFHRMLDTLGAFVGVIIAVFILWFLKDQNIENVCRKVFTVSAILALFSLAISLFVKEQKISKKKFDFKLNLSDLNKKYWVTLGILSTFAFANSSDTFLLLKASDVGLSPLQVVLAYALYNFCYASFSLPAGKLSDKLGKWKMILAGWSIYALVYAGIAFTSSYYLWFLFALYGIYMALTEGVSKALISDTIPNHAKGTAFGILYMSLGFSALSSNIIAGYSWDNFGKSTPFIIGSATSIIAIALLMLNKKFLKN